MAKNPYMKFYLGDWEQDLNDVSGEAELAWFKVVLKMHQNDQSGIYKNSKKNLQRLWKLDTIEEVDLIIEELNIADIGNISVDGSVVYFQNRRMIREKELSDKRANAGAKGGAKTQAKIKQDENFAKAKEQAKGEHNCDSDYEYNNKIGVEKKSIKIPSSQIVKSKEDQEKEYLGPEPVRMQIVTNPSKPPSLHPYLDELANYFHVIDSPSMHMPRRQMNNFLEELEDSGEIDYFKTQTDYYFKLKKLNGLQICSWRTWIGAGGNEPKWSESDYEAQYITEEQKKSFDKKNGANERLSQEQQEYLVSRKDI